MRTLANIAVTVGIPLVFYALSRKLWGDRLWERDRRYRTVTYVGTGMLFVVGLIAWIQS